MEGNSQKLDLSDPKTLIGHTEEIKSKNFEKSGLFIVKRANDWIKESKGKPIPRMLFDEFWFEGELCILVADTNQGKSILAVQIGDSISKGVPIEGFKLEAVKQPVLYFDFELSAKQFEGRYSKKLGNAKLYSNHYDWDDNFIRVEINPRADLPSGKNFEEYIRESMETAIENTNAKILIIDNLTYLKNDVEKAKDASAFIKSLQLLIDQKVISILALTHTPKRILFKPMDRNEISGSKRIIDFCDSAFAIGESHQDTGLKYFKQIKVRQNEHIYDSENVILCQLNKAYNFLQFEFLGFASEREHLKEVSDLDKEHRLIMAKELKDKGMSQTAIANHFGVSEGAVRKWLKKQNP